MKENLKKTYTNTNAPIFRAAVRWKTTRITAASGVKKQSVRQIAGADTSNAAPKRKT